MADGKEKIYSNFHLKYSQKIKDIKGEMQRENLCEFLLFGTA